MQKPLMNGCGEGTGMIMKFEKKLFVTIATVAIALALCCLIIPIGN